MKTSDIRNWYNRIAKDAPKDAQVVLAANKIDMSDKRVSKNWTNKENKTKNQKSKIKKKKKKIKKQKTKTKTKNQNKNQKRKSPKRKERNLQRN